MKKEFDSLIACKCWSLIPQPDNARVLSGMWVYDVKVDGEGKIIQDKARYIAWGNMQIPGINYNKS